jgi:hypothetical protein
MRNTVFVVACLLGFFLGPTVQDSAKNHMTAERQQYIRYTKSRGRIRAESLPITDSLGGKALLGYINMEVRVTIDSSLHGYRVGRIEISPDTLHWFVYSRHRHSSWGDSLLREFKPWIDEVYGHMHAVDTQKDSLFLINDTLWYNYIVNFGSVSQEFVRKRFGKPIYRGGSQGE